MRAAVAAVPTSSLCPPRPSSNFTLATSTPGLRTHMGGRAGCVNPRRAPAWLHSLECPPRRSCWKQPQGSARHTRWHTPHSLNVGFSDHVFKHACAQASSRSWATSAAWLSARELATLPVIQSDCRERALHCSLSNKSTWQTKRLYVPKHIMSPQIEHLGPGSIPPEGSPDRASCLQMQTNARSLMGTGLFLPRAHPQAVTPFVINCEHI